ncbi:MAG: four helix bundle protein [Bacteroidales bacterium]|nr:four helix bundle protein [Bacteroidales bacterium]
MNQDDLLKRTKHFALDAILLFNQLPKNDLFRTLGKQFLRASTSVGANYRAASLARSKKEFYAKLCIVLEEADECVYWLELMEESTIHSEEIIKKLKQEAQELVLIFSKSRKTVKNSLNSSR